ncbi:uncharacterized protein BDW47DRAFT_104020 [Aspergillus candidus]|uniref:Uncharacterized protein n=1 Tax=Aspergillus candidus TaxID=41067 RepID=A0A2I2FEC1_ASPCN|nr:hypothetical protein BDW47DRAFT_104020 [Aspergillus candidus]PLB38968.1 hypothetical protein BDW47DRAFT_104020 [Aspergillus candidus]
MKPHLPDPGPKKMCMIVVDGRPQASLALQPSRFNIVMGPLIDSLPQDLPDGIQNR